MGKYLQRLRQVAITEAQFGKSPKQAVKDERARSRVHQGIVKGMESSSSNSNTTSSSNNSRLPLSEVVSECVKRWFKDTLKEAKSGDINMQVLVGQMYYSGYGVPRDAQKVLTQILLCQVNLSCCQIKLIV